ncbi:MAG: hypothetical protein U5L96_02635 [Owenweeksia sp.]|nr:hypothetical protein [Owenweeksia sp.]
MFHNLHRSYSFGDFQNIASYQSIGAAIENLSLFLKTKGIITEASYFPHSENKELVALLTFQEGKPKEGLTAQLVSAIPNRTTNRVVDSRQEIPEEKLQQLAAIATQELGTELKWITNEAELEEQGKLSRLVISYVYLIPGAIKTFFIAKCAGHPGGHKQGRWY